MHVLSLKLAGGEECSQSGHGEEAWRKPERESAFSSNVSHCSLDRAATIATWGI